MTIRQIVDDIRIHAAAFLGEVRLRPMVRMAAQDSLNDIVVFQSRSGREHVVALAVSRDAEDGWSRAMIAPLNVKEVEIEGTGWTYRNLEGVRPDDIVLLKDFATVEERVAAIVEHIVSHGDAYVPQDDTGACVCTDPRILDVVARLERVAAAAQAEHSISITGQDLASGDQLVDTVTLETEDGRAIDVTLGTETILVALTSPSGDFEFRISGMSVFDQAMEQVEERMAIDARGPVH